MYAPPESSLVVFVIISSKSVSFCDRFHVKLVILAEITHFEGASKFKAFVRRIY